MDWNVQILKKAEQDIAWFKKHQIQYYKKCYNLINEIAQNPRQGTGKPIISQMSFLCVRFVADSVDNLVIW